MVGHTGNLEATVIALEAINLAIGRILRAEPAPGDRWIGLYVGSRRGCGVAVLSTSR